MKIMGYYELWRKRDTSSGSKTRKQRRLLPDLGGGEALISWSHILAPQTQPLLIVNLMRLTPNPSYLNTKPNLIRVDNFLTRVRWRNIVHLFNLEVLY